jgi:thiamine-phosphate pyrophosphorylase
VFPPLYAIVDVELTSHLVNGLSSGHGFSRAEKPEPSGVLTPEGSAAIKLAVTLADAGVKLIQLRDKKSSSWQFFTTANAMAHALIPRGIQFVVNDRADIAAIVGASGVHVGQDDLPVEDARKLCRPPMWVGVSTHNIAQLQQAIATSADYIAVGPIFATQTKENPDPVVGLDLIREARKMTQKPLVAIGGITLENAADVYAAGADSIAVIRDLALATDPAAQARKYLAVAESAISR